MNRSRLLYERACKVIPGGVNSPVRAFRGVGGKPVFIANGKGAYVYDVDGKEYIDYVGSWGPMILGHARKEILAAIAEQLPTSTSFGAPTALEVELAELIAEMIPSIEMIRMVNSGTEATMSAVRLARGYTKRDVIIKCNGCYHGHADTLLVKAGSGVATLGIAGSPGVPEEVAKLCVSIEYNDSELLEQTILRIGPERIAAFIVEPVPGNMGLILPKMGYLKSVREICSRYGIVLIFDEVMSGFRVALGGAEERYGVTADLTTFGKVIGGGLPVGAFGGKREIMEQLAPLGPVYQAGTLSGNPLAMSAGIAMLKLLKEQMPYQQLENNARNLLSGLVQIASKRGIAIQTAVCGGMFGFFFSDRPVHSYADALTCNQEQFKKFFHAMLKAGVYLPPSPFEACFISTEHRSEVISKTLEIVESSLI
jgi:glutamate-1-semialdehyde 2,1-aminomutase